MDAALITTTAYAWIGKITRDDERFVHLEQASRVFNDGRFGAFVREGRHENAEIEHVGEDTVVQIPHTAIVDMVEWKHPLPTTDQ